MAGREVFVLLVFALVCSWLGLVSALTYESGNDGMNHFVIHGVLGFAAELRGVGVWG